MRCTSSPHASTQLLLVLPLLLLLVTSAQQPQQQPQLEAVLAANNVTLWLKVLQIAGVSREVQAAAVRYVAFTPNDAAVNAFLSSMGLSVEGLQERPALAKFMVAQHLILAVPPEAQQQLLQGGKPLSLPTLALEPLPDANFTKLTLKVAQKQPLQLKVTDGQGYTAESVNIVSLGPNKTVVVLNRVLMSGQYFFTFDSMCRQLGATTATMCAALTQSGMLTNASSPAFPNTVMFPGRQAWAASDIQLGSLSTTASKELVQYHLLPGLHAFPDGLVDGQVYATLLQGAAGLRIAYESHKASSGDTKPDLRAFVVTPSQRVPVVVYNVFVGQAVVQGITAVLVPPGGKAAASAAGAPAAPVTTEKAAKVASSSANGRHLLDDPVRSAVSYNAAETAIRDRTRSMFREEGRKWG